VSERIHSLFGNNTTFLLVIAVLIALAGLIFKQPILAMWLGFALAGFSAISNDSIQTLGTFLASNRKVNWKIIWFFIGGIMIATITYSWLSYGGDISYGRLDKIPQPQYFSFLHLLAPIILLILTRFQMPVSTTFLLLSVFSSSKTIEGMLAKTFFGYVLAFTAAIIIWGTIGYFVKLRQTIIQQKITKKEKRKWRILQWCSTGFLWSAWLAQDNANAAVFLPRDITFTQLVAVLIFMTLALGYILYRRGGSIQQIVTEKTDVIFVKSATLIDFIYAIILVYFKWLNNLPMSTTWIFLGLLAGREIALKVTTQKNIPYQKTLLLVRKDLMRAGFGLGVSLALAFFINGNL